MCVGGSAKVGGRKSDVRPGAVLCALVVPRRSEVGHLMCDLYGFFVRWWFRGGRKSEFGSRRSEVGRRGSEVGGRRSCFVGRESEVGDRWSEVGGRRSDVRGRARERDEGL